MGPNPLHEIILAHSAKPVDEMLFADRVARNLREGTASRAN